MLFAIVFAETGLVVTPFLPGDSLLFAAGALAATGALDVRAAVRAARRGRGPGEHRQLQHRPLHRAARVQRRTTPSGLLHRLLNRDHLDRAHAFFERHGGKAVVLTRFVPIVRTFVPFVAGAGAMSYARFAFYNLVGGVLWVGICTLGAGYAFGNVPIVKENFSLVALGIVVVSVLPIGIEMIRHRGSSERSHTSTTGGAGRRAAAGPTVPLYGARRSTACVPTLRWVPRISAGSGSPTPAHQAPIQSG